LALAETIRQLSSAAKSVRTSMWSGLQATVLFSRYVELASVQREIADDVTLDPKVDKEDETTETEM